LLATQITRKSGGRILSLALLGGMTLSPMLGDRAPSVHAATRTAQTWLSFEGPWLCRTWTVTPASFTPGATTPEHRQVGVGWFGFSDAASGTTLHCTLQWYVTADGQLISDMPTWVPNPTGQLVTSETLADVRLYHQLKAVQPAKPVMTKWRLTVTKPASPTSPTRGSGGTGGTGGASGTPGQWTPVPGHPSYGMSDFGGDPYAGYFGYCTWYAWYMRQGEPLMRLGMADQWVANAPRYGLHVGSTPAVGATVVFQPGVEGAGSGGHAGHVEVVLGNGWFIISEMNFYWNGGGWGRVDWRYAHVGSGVSFIY
jgi:surface antigen